MVGAKWQGGVVSPPCEADLRQSMVMTSLWPLMSKVKLVLVSAKQNVEWAIISLL